MSAHSKPTARRLTTGLAAAALLAGPLVVAVPALASSTSNEIVYVLDVDNDGAAALVLRNVSSGATTTLLPASVDDFWVYEQPELSPDGNHVVVASNYEDQGLYRQGIVRVNRDGSGAVRLTNPPDSSETTTSYTDRFDASPAVSPDGTTVLFVRTTCVTQFSTESTTCTGRLHTVPLATGTTTAHPLATDVASVDWSPDGQQIVFDDTTGLAEDQQGTLKTWSAGTGATSLGVTGSSPSWSPGGSTIAYSAYDGTNVRIATVPAAGGTARVLGVTRPVGAKEPTYALSPHWMPDGQSLIYSFHTESTYAADIYGVDTRGTRAAAVVSGAADQWQGNTHGPAPAAVSAGAASTFTPLPDPGRIVDTRKGVGAPEGALQAGKSLTVQVRGDDLPTTAEGVTVDVPADATAVVLNLTAINPSTSTYLQVHPADTTGTPRTSNLNAPKGSVIPNAVTVAVGQSGDGAGKVKVYNAAGSVGVLVDIAGYYTAGAAGAGYEPISPKRIMDSRRTSKVTSTRDLVVVGELPVYSAVEGETVTVPAEATAVVLNLTGLNAERSTAVRAYPKPASDSSPLPTVSSLNVAPGQVSPNLVTVRVGEGGAVRFHTSGGALDLFADLAGYYLPGSGQQFVPVSPARFLDTRSGTGTVPARLDGGQTADVKVAGFRGVPDGASAAVLNLTAVQGTSSTVVRGFPTPAGSEPAPTVSNLNPPRGVTIANLAIVATGDDGRVRVHNSTGSLHTLADLAGYFVPAG